LIKTQLGAGKRRCIMKSVLTLTDLIISRKDEVNRGITFIPDESHEEFVSYQDLARQAQGLLFHLQAAGFRPGDEVVFQIEENRRFVFFFWACVLGGLIPVPVTVGANDEHRMKLLKIWQVLRHPRLIADRNLLAKLESYALENGLAEQIAEMKRHTVFGEEISPGGRPGVIHSPQPGDTAFIQFSSGSTGDPKGVIITHDNVLVNLRAVIRWIKLEVEDSGLNWMPLTHDMGLIGTHIKGLLAGINQYNMPTSLFIRHPTLWMEKASQHGVSILCSPNFGYKHFLKFFSSGVRKNWDLSRVRLIFNGAEPISTGLCNEFLDQMSVYGLKRNAMYPVYGLAEGTIAVTFPLPGDDFMVHTLNRDFLSIGAEIRDTTAGDPKGIPFVDEGYPIDYCAVRICDEEHHDLGENKIGYIQIRGGNVTSGYYNNPEATASAISDDGWLNTGDLGFLRNKRLAVTGRAKDIIFMAGQNYYSHDIERIAESVDGIELGKVAAVGVFDPDRGHDQLILFVLFKQKTENFLPIITGLRKTINQQLGIDLSEVIPVKNMPKTTSGKVQRYKLRESFSHGEFDPIRHELSTRLNEKHQTRKVDSPETPLQEELVRIWSEVLDIEKIGIHDNFFELGGNSLKASRAISRIQHRYQVELPQGQFLETPDIARLSQVIETAAGKKPSPDGILLESSAGDGRLPLSFAQQRLWFLDRLNGNSAQYNLASALRLRGSLDQQLLSASLAEVMQRHQVLRASFGEDDGQAFQIINPVAGIEIPLVDLSQVPEEERERRALELAREESAQPFRLENAPLIRGTLFRLGANEHLFLLAAHHIIFDGWSFGILLKELAFYYEKFRTGRSGSLPELKIQYPDFVRWQARRLQGDFLDQQLQYWKNQLPGKLPVLNLPLDQPRPVVQSFNGGKLVQTLPPGLVRDCERLAQREGVTLFMVLLAAFKTLLHRYTGQEDLIAGSPIANRNQWEIEGIIGFFTNNLVLRTRLSGGMSFRELLNHVKKTTLEAYTYQDLPFEKLVEALRPERDMSQNPLFQVLFSLQNVPPPIREFAGITLETVDLDSRYARFDLTLDLWETGETLAATLEYNTDLFYRETISRMAGHYQQLLENIVKNPAMELYQFEMLTDAEKQTLLRNWNHTGVDFDPESGWVRLFEARAETNPAAVAVVSGDSQLDYRELNSRANRLARYLSANGAGPEVIVAVYLERTPDMLVGLLGIQKANAAYLPLDPIFPRERLGYMLEEARAPLLITQTGLLDSLPEHQAKVICLDSAWQEISAQNGENPAPPPGANHLAYLIYTSGSTGKPKGVQIEQPALKNFLLSMARDTGLTEKDSLLAVTTLSFDIAGLELFLPLLAGAKVVLATRDEAAGGEPLIQILNRQAITFMQATPATWRLLIDSGWRGNPDLKILCGGEALPLDLAHELLNRCACLWNVYGPTETTIWSTMVKLEPGAGLIPIGKPIANTQVYVLDPDMNPVPIGIPGELYIGGTGLSRGYRAQPQLTGEKFVPNPFCSRTNSKAISDFGFQISEFKNPQSAIGNPQLNTSVICNPQLNNPQSRMYKTGDLVRWLPDGNLEFVGRIDHQVKIRGYRIELGEIEAVLGRYPAVHECVVVAKEISPGEKSLVAYYIPSPGADPGELNVSHLRKFLREKLPDYMVPAAFVMLDAFPMTPNGKIDRKVLPVPENLRPELETGFSAASNALEQKISAIWQEVLKLDRIGINDNFFDLGGHSLLLAQVRGKIGKALQKEISMIDLFKYPTINTLANYLEQERGGKTGRETRLETSKSRNRGLPSQHHEIAVIGLSSRFPGAQDPEQFWKNLCEGRELITRFSDPELLAEGVDPNLLNNPDYVKAWGMLDGIEKFDARFFGYNPREAEILDPQQRIFLEEAWKALENAGYDSEKFPGLIGVFAGVGMNTYLQNLSNYGDPGQLANDYQIMISNDKDFLATRVAYKLNLEGPGITVQTACSTSLVAAHLACQSLMNGECDIALAGGVSIRLPQKTGYLYQEGMILSPDGHCRAFDAKAKGTVGGNGAGVVVLKRLEDALADGDNISAVIKGSAINNDGALKIGYTAPRIEGQARVIAEAQARAGVDPGTITYIETHGTGTPLGDPIEIEALTQAFRGKTARKRFCAIGSVKTNLGHLDAAAGVAGLAKTVLALRHKVIPPSLHFEEPNPKIDFENSPFYVNTRLAEWKTNGAPLRAGVSSFGIGGTNAHLVLEEAPALPESGRSRSRHLMILSAKTEAALDQMTRNLAAFLRDHPGSNPADTAYTLQMGRREFSHRRFVTAATPDDAVSALGSLDPERVFRANPEEKTRKITFMFPGQGAQYINMALELYREEPVFAGEVDRCAEILIPHLGLDLKKILFPEETSSDAASRQLTDTAFTQPALFVIEYALAKLWISWGITPQAMIGHSIGEYVAACLAGVFSLDDALKLVAARGRLMGQQPPGSMLAVSLNEKETAPYLSGDLALAAVNAPSLCVISGSPAAVDQLERQLKEKEVFCQRLHTSHAFHSKMMEPALEPFTELVRKIKLNPPTIPYLSNLTGAWITAGEATNPEYWTAQLRQTVRFADGVRELAQDPDQVLLEVGPGNTLTSLARQQLQKNSGHAVLSSLRHPRESQSDILFLLNALGKLWLAGVKIDWGKLYSGQSRRRVPLPVYPFESKPFWVKKRPAPASRERQPGKSGGVSQWFYAPVWKQSVQNIRFQPEVSGGLKPGWLIMLDSNAFHHKIVQRLQRLGYELTKVTGGTEFKKLDPDSYSLNFDTPDHYSRLWQSMAENNRKPDRIVNLLGITAGDSPLSIENCGDYHDRLFFSLLYLAQALGRLDGLGRVQCKILTNNMHRIFNETVLFPEKNTLLGPCKVIPQEYPNIRCHSIDIVLPEPGSGTEEELIDLLIAEIHAEPEDSVIAYRGTDRWVETFEPLTFEPQTTAAVPLRECGVYLITGGLGGIGLALAEYLAGEARAKLVLVNRSEFPIAEEWETWLAGHDPNDKISQKIKQLQLCRDSGAEILVCRADVSEIEQMRAVVTQALQKFGAVHGVIHAAGNPGGGMIQLKKREFAETVFLPKVQGTLALYESVKNLPLDFVILCSSLNAITGGFGQVDYSSANAFLDAFAQARDSRRGTRWISVNWDRWPGVGMASDPVGASGGAGLREKGTHPLLEWRVANTPERVIYASEFSPAKHWVLSEHLVVGTPTIAGTTYLEMARAAYEESVAAGPVSIREVVFLTPMAVKEHETRDVLAILSRNGAAYEFRIISKLQTENSWLEHARGKIEPAAPEPAPKFNLPDLINQCNEREIAAAGDQENPARKFIYFGNRWKSLQQFRIGKNEALAELELPPEFVADLARYKLHPALLDVATGSARLVGGGNYLPFSYERLTIRNPLPEKLFASLRFKNDAAESQEIITCDIDIFDHHGASLVEIRNFSMRRVSENAAADLKARAYQEYPRIETSGLEKLISGRAQRESNPLNEGISFTEGKEAFRRILERGDRPRIIVSTKEIRTAIEQAGFINQPDLAEGFDEAAAATALHWRPDLKNDYVPPKNETEKKLAGLWQKLLGIEAVGIHDDFFELGGHSLLLVQFYSKLKEAFQTEIPVVDLYKYTTIAVLAKYLNQDTAGEQPVFEEVNKRASQQIEAMKQRRQQMMNRGKKNE
jgi:amino acid adenylation domain-containing protein